MNDDPQRRPGWRRWYRAVERERLRLDAFYDEPPAPARQVPLDQVVNGVMKDWGLDRNLWHQELMEAWPELVGRQVAGRARPGPLDRGVLTVFVSSSAWLQELSRFAHEQILRKVRERFGNQGIRSIRLQLDPDLEHARPPRSRFRRPGGPR